MNKVATKDFKTLFEEEQKFVHEHRSRKDAPSERLGHSVACPDLGEPWVASTSFDQVGIALSGGGIRSATFNLGILQALQGAGLLSKVDYLSTVSGGGYIGSFWKRWRKSYPNGEVFPSPKNPIRLNPNNESTDAIRHLREFSRFLVPRLDIFEAELWAALGKVCAGLIFSLVFGIAVIASIIFFWALLTNWLVYHQPNQMRWADWLLSTAIFTFLIVATFLWTETQAVRRGKLEVEKGRGCRAYNHRAPWVLLLLIAGWLAIRYFANPRPIGPFFPDRDNYTFAWINFVPAIYLGGSFLLIAGFRLVAERFRPISHSHETHIKRLKVSAAYDRIQAGILWVALTWTAFATLWEIGSWLNTTAQNNARVAVFGNSIVSFFGGTAAGLAALFAAMRKWIVGTQEDRLKGDFTSNLKYTLTHLVALVVIIFASITIIMVCCDIGGTLKWRSIPLGVPFIPLSIAALMMIFIDPMALSLHEFYRARLARCYLGAANLDATTVADNRQTFERPKDDMHLKDDNNLPIHLICCAANIVGDDRLSTLYRGARSAVLSRFGVAISNAVAPPGAILLSSALTASAAAFNSNMGRLSILYGRASCFLMTMLNLRLGLWICHPQSTHDSIHDVNISLLRELFGLTRCEIVRCDDQSTIANPTGSPELDSEFLDEESSSDSSKTRSLPPVHLSDGGHFENLGLYELVRRHCRYVIVSDSAADPNYSFGDLANAVRRIREDFGIESESDTTALRPRENGFAPQHMAIGTIHYDGLNGIDKGVVLFFKPVLTGNEPTDILEYRRSNCQFPQQSTGDQFYSEAQWESYRRLGEHAMQTVLNELNELDEIAKVTPEIFFRSARLSSEEPPWTDSEIYSRISTICSELEEFFRQTAPKCLLHELLPEFNASPQAEEPSSDTFFVLLRILQMAEDVVVGCDLYKFWSHPLACGWMCYLCRWTNLPTLRRMWPILKPLFAPALGTFLEQRCGLPVLTEVQHRTQLVEYNKVDRDWRHGYAARQWFREQGDKETASTHFFGLEYYTANSTWLQVGIACIEIEGLGERSHRTAAILDSFALKYDVSDNDWLQASIASAPTEEQSEFHKCAVWNWNDLRTVNFLQGGGFTRTLLDGLLVMLPALGCTYAEVRFRNHDDELVSAGRRRQIIELVDFYRSRKFAWHSSSTMRRTFSLSARSTHLQE